jgi:hypothetical protein
MKEIPLTQGQVAIVDDGDFEWLSQWKWKAFTATAMKTAYAYRSKKRVILMHRAIMGEPTGKVVDHINHDTLDNRRDNLRTCTWRESNFNRLRQSNNRSGYIGVFWDKWHNRWKAMITVDGKQVRLGSFKDAVSAARARDAAIKRLHGDFAVLNDFACHKSDDSRVYDGSLEELN